MRSRLAEQSRDEQQRRAGEMSSAEGVATALALGERAIADYMQNFGVGRSEAVRILRRAGQAGRRYCACLDDEAHAGPDRRSR
jgi:hypothetical protein